MCAMEKFLLVTCKKVIFLINRIIHTLYFRTNCSNSSVCFILAAPLHVDQLHFASAWSLLASWAAVVQPKSGEEVA